MTWLLAKETILIPLALRASINAIGASNMNGLEPLEWAGAEGVSKLTNPKSAFLKTSLTSAKRSPQPWVSVDSPFALAAAAAARTGSWGMTSPATAKLTGARSWGQGAKAAASRLEWVPATQPAVAARIAMSAPVARWRRCLRRLAA